MISGIHRMRRVVALVGVVLLTSAVAPAPGTTAPEATPRPAQSATVPEGAWWYEALQLERVWEITKGAGVTVAVIDTGVKADIGDLQGQVLPGKDYTKESPDGRIDKGAQDNRNFGHGTYMASLIAGTGNGAGLIGIAPEAKILPVRLGTDELADEIQATADAIRWAVDRGVEMINLSRGNNGPCALAVQEAVTYAVEHDVIVVAAAGNSPNLPVGTIAQCVGSIGVGAIDQDFRPWSGQSSGPALDFVAAGAKMPIEMLDETFVQSPGGTSAATAIVSGVFALLRSHFPNESARRIVTRVLWNVHNGPQVKGFAKRINDQLGYGEPLPYFALTEKTAPDAANPIYDQIETWMAQNAPTTPASPDTGGDGDTNDDGDTAGDEEESGISPVWLIAGGVGVLLLLGLILAAILLAARRRPAPHAVRPGQRPGPPPPPPAG